MASHIISFSSHISKADEQQEANEEQHPPIMMIQIDRKTSDALAMAMTNGTTADDLTPMSLLDIMRESSTLLRANSSPLMWAILLFICPLSALLLSATLLQTHIAMALSTSLRTIATAVGIQQSSLYRSLYPTLSQIVTSYCLSSPLYLTTWTLAKAFIIFTVSSTYSARKPSLPMFISIAYKLWKRLFYTYMCIMFVFFIFFCLGTILLFITLTSLTALLLPASLIFLAEMVLGLLGSTVFAHLIVIANLAPVVSILEDNIGLSSLLRSLQLIKGKTQLALSLFLATAVGTASIESLYQYRVIGVPEGSYMINTTSRLWEGPLLIFMYSFLYLYDSIMSCVFYFTCKSGAPPKVGAENKKPTTWQLRVSSI